MKKSQELTDMKIEEDRRQRKSLYNIQKVCIWLIKIDAWFKTCN